MISHSKIQELSVSLGHSRLADQSKEESIGLTNPLFCLFKPFSFWQMVTFQLSLSFHSKKLITVWLFYIHLQTIQVKSWQKPNNAASRCLQKLDDILLPRGQRQCTIWYDFYVKISSQVLVFSVEVTIRMYNT